MAGVLRSLDLMDQLFTHRAMLEEMRVTTCDIDQERLPAGLRLTLQIYAQILEDGLSVLNSILAYLENGTDGHMEEYSDG